MSQSRERSGEGMNPLEAESTGKASATDQSPKIKAEESPTEGRLEQAATAEIRESSSPVRIARSALALNEAFVNSGSSPTQDTISTPISPHSPAQEGSLRQSPHAQYSAKTRLTSEQAEGNPAVQGKSPKTQEDEISVYARGPCPVPPSLEEELIFLERPSSRKTELTSVYPQRELLAQEMGSRMAYLETVLANTPKSPKSVLEYLNKKGYSRSEAMLRIESSTEAGSLQTKADEPIGIKYLRAFELMMNYIEGALDIYKADLRRFRWPVFVYSFLQLASDGHGSDSRAFFQKFKDIFEAEHSDELRALQPIHLPEHVTSNATAKIFLGNKYRLRVNGTAFSALILFLENTHKQGSAVLVNVIQSKLQTVTFESSTDNQSFLAKLLDRARQLENHPAEDEGIPGHNAGSANTDQAPGSTVLARLRLGPLPMDPDYVGEVRARLDEEDARHPPAEGQISLSQHFDQQIKREESEDAPSRTELPLPASSPRDIAMEVQKVKENRDRFKIESRTGGVGPAVSVVMYTFHNTHDSINCLDFSQDNLLVAAGMSESYIRVWTLDGKPLPTSSSQANGSLQPSGSRRLIGHSGSVYNVSFSPSAQTPNASANTSNTTTSKYLLSCSADKTVRLWSLETWSCVVVYKEHNDIVWDVRWGPFGHYFLTGSHDRTARLWSTDHIEALRMFVGHDNDVDVVCFHPNNAYTFTGSCDKTVRMWKVTDGTAVRLFTGHTGSITSMACSPSGKILASADDHGTIILWDLAPGKLLKRMRGHQKAGIWSLTWSVESTVLVSGAGDGTVRVWDIAVPNDAAGGQGRVIGEGGAGQKINVDGGAQGQGVGGKKKGKDVVVTSDQISAFPTKKSPVYKVHFTRQNLILAGGAYLP